MRLVAKECAKYKENFKFTSNLPYRDSMNLFSFTIILYSTANANGSSNLNALLSQRNIEIPFYYFSALLHETSLRLTL